MTLIAVYISVMLLQVYLFPVAVFRAVAAVGTVVLTGSGSSRGKMPRKNKSSEISCVECSLLRAEGFSCSLDVLYGGLGIP
jgi:hypothetical protein